MPEVCTCGLAMRMNSTVAAMALAELRKHDPEAVDRIITLANQKVHKEWCGNAVKWLKRRSANNVIPVETNQ